MNIMIGIDFRDTIIIRQSINKGTKVIETPWKKANWQGKEFKQHQAEILNLAGDLMIISAKGTSMIKLSKMQKSKTVDIKGHYITTRRGTDRVRL